VAETGKEANMNFAPEVKEYEDRVTRGRKGWNGNAQDAAKEKALPQPTF